MEYAYLNGKIVPADEVSLSLSDPGYLYGAGLFETMRAYGGRLFLLNKHLARLAASAATLGVEGVDVEKLAEACRDTILANRLESARVRLTVTFEPVNSSGQSKIAAVSVRAQFYSPPPLEKYTQGYTVVISPFTRFSGSVLTCHKTTSRLDCLLARSHAAAAGFDEALFLNERGCLTEASGANIFLVDAGGKLLTPPVGDGLLPGVTREVVMGLAKGLGFGVAEQSLGFEDLENAREAFLTNSMIEVMPLASVAGGGRENVFQRSKVAGELVRAYRAAVKAR